MVIARHPGMKKKICDDSDCKPMFKPDEVEGYISDDIAKAVLGDNSEYFDCDFGAHTKDVDTLEPAEFRGDLEVYFDDDWNETPCKGPECPAVRKMRHKKAGAVTRKRDMINGKLVDAKNPESAEIEVEDEVEVDESCGKSRRRQVKESIASKIRRRKAAESRQHSLAEDISDQELYAAIASDLRKRGIINKDVTEDFDIVTTDDYDDLSDDVFVEEVGKKVIAPRKLREAAVDIEGILRKTLANWKVKNEDLTESDKQQPAADHTGASQSCEKEFSKFIGKEVADGNGLKYTVKQLVEVSDDIARIRVTAVTGPWKGKDFEFNIGKNSRYFTDNAVRKQFSAFLDFCN